MTERVSFTGWDALAAAAGQLHGQLSRAEFKKGFDEFWQLVGRTSLRGVLQQQELGGDGGSSSGGFGGGGVAAGLQSLRGLRAWWFVFCCVLLILAGGVLLRGVLPLGRRGVLYARHPEL